MTEVIQVNVARGRGALEEALRETDSEAPPATG